MVLLIVLGVLMLMVIVEGAFILQDKWRRKK